MNMKELRAYAALMEVEWQAATFDGGQSVTLLYLPGIEPGYTGPFTIRLSYLWDEPERFIDRAIRWLNTLPWPSDDDPRVIHEGVYS